MAKSIFDYKGIQRNLARDQKTIQRKFAKDQKNIQKNFKKDQKAIQKQTRILISKEGRVPINAKRKKEVYEKYKNKCFKCPARAPLQIHHKNGNNRTNSLANLVLLCANCHYKIHAKGSNLNKTIRKRNQRRNISLFRI
jgi:hypothetical protein